MAGALSGPAYADSDIDARRREIVGRERRAAHRRHDPERRVHQRRTPARAFRGRVRPRSFSSSSCKSANARHAIIAALSRTSPSNPPRWRTGRMSRRSYARAVSGIYPETFGVFAVKVDKYGAGETD